MATYRITAPDGNVYDINAPDDATEDQVMAYAQANYQQPSGFANVRSGVSSTEAADGRLTEEQWQQERDRIAAQNPVADSSRYGRYLTGLAASGRDTLVGLKQAATRGAQNLMEFGPNETAASRAIGEVADRQEAEEAAYRETTGAMRSDPYVMAGNVVGTMGQLFLPGAAARGTAVGRSFLPTTVRGNALQGAGLGTIQPVTGEGERVGNTGLGFAGGGAGAAVPKVAGAVTRAATGALSRPTLSGAERRAAELIAAESAGVNSLMTPQPSRVPGVVRTLAEETMDPGVARLERQVRGQTNIFQPIETANNAARVRAIEQFAGDEASLAAARADRTRGTTPLLGQAYLDRGVDVGAVRAQLGSQIKASETRPSVQSALLDVENALEKAGDDVYSLYGVRKYIDDLMSGKAGSEKSYARAAKRELMQIKETLDDQIAAKSPAFAEYLQNYRSLSAPINRQQIGQELISPSSGGSVLDPETGLQVLTPASFSRKARDLDAVAAKATKFKGARADASLTPDDIATIRAVQDDLQRQSFRATAGSGGNSMTAERLALQDRMGSRVAARIPLVGGFVEALDQLGKQRVNERLAYLLANPDEARRVLAAMNKKDRATVSNALFQLSARGGASLPALAE